jgi:hypothetical protein
MWQQDGRWHARMDPADLVDADLVASTRQACLVELRRRAAGSALTVEVVPPLAGVAEAASIMGWDKRRVITYLNRRSFPEPVAALASGRVWRRADIEAFARAWHARHALRRRPGPGPLAGGRTK